MSRAIRLETSGFRQTKAMCGPACLKIVAAYFDIDVSQERLRRACRSSPVSGTTGANLVKGARAIGLAAEIRDRAGFDHIARWLGKGVPVIVDWMSTAEEPSGLPVAGGHYSVVCGLSRNAIVLEDPAIGKRKTLTRRTFRKLWFDFTHLYPKTKDDLVIRRMIVAAPKMVMSQAGILRKKRRPSVIDLPGIKRERKKQSSRRGGQAIRRPDRSVRRYRRQAAKPPARQRRQSPSRRI
jgi:ABC-type bacteriocin/lantibiotic exporter with double-glycine peptidase domain